MAWAKLLERMWISFMELTIPYILRSVDSIDFSWALSVTPGPGCFVRNLYIHILFLLKKMI